MPQLPAAMAALSETIIKVAEFVGQHAEVQELDLNPVIAYPEGVIAVDARIVISGN